jgi:hypothetical protein
MLMKVVCEIDSKYLALIKKLSEHIYALPVELDHEIRQLLDNEDYVTARNMIESAKETWGDTALTELSTICDFLAY